MTWANVGGADFSLLPSSLTHSLWFSISLSLISHFLSPSISLPLSLFSLPLSISLIFFCFLAISRSSCLFRTGFGFQFSTFYVIHRRSQLSTNLFSFIICELSCIIRKDGVVSRYPLIGLEFSFPSGERIYLLETKKTISEIERERRRQGWEE